MGRELRDIEPFYGWLELYSHEEDEKSPFYGVEHNMFYYDRSINHIPAHPLWDDFGSESLLVKILYVNYQDGYAIIELFGEWNDLFDNDYKLLAENCLTYLIDHGVNKFILICENVFHIYLERDDYYEALQEELADGWICTLRLREEVKKEMVDYHISPYFYWSDLLDEIAWRKLKPFQLFAMVNSRIYKALG
ncbi:MAG: hypothetical protein KDD63_22940 [Bacteroidetes bacterium]|nr:hypothetical protein [Bacteroidota bacterium]MCB0855104.1 hypothetical protein [Bacteroidota bacterium]